MDILGPVVRRYAQVAYDGLTTKPGRTITVQPGAEVAWDQCDCDGQVWARVVRVTGGTGPTKANGLPCGVAWWNLQMAVGVLRCVPTVGDDGSFPSDGEISTAGDRFAADMSELLNAVVCDPETRQIVEAVPLGPDGGCAGSEIVFVVRVPVCECY